MYYTLPIFCQLCNLAGFQLLAWIYKPMWKTVWTLVNQLIWINAVFKMKYIMFSMIRVNWAFFLFVFPLLIASSLLITYANNLYPTQARQNTLVVFLNYFFFKKVDFWEKKQQTTKSITLPSPFLDWGVASGVSNIPYPLKIHRINPYPLTVLQDF